MPIMRIFLPFLLLSLAELFLLIRFATLVGVFACLLFLLGKALLASLLLRKLGLAALSQARLMLSRGVTPLQQLSDGLLIGAGGFLLMLPGFISDLVGLACLLPAVRRLLLARLRAPDAAQNQVIDGEFEAIDPQKPQSPPAYRPEKPATKIFLKSPLK